MFPCTPLVYSLGALCSFFIYILLFTDQKKKKTIENQRIFPRYSLVYLLHFLYIIFLIFTLYFVSFLFHYFLYV